MQMTSTFRKKIVPNSKFPSHCKVQILSNHRIKWHILLPHVANQFLRHLSCLSRLPRRCLGTGLQCLGEVHLVRDHVASATGIRNTWIVSGILRADSLPKTTTTFWGNSNRQWIWPRWHLRRMINKRKVVRWGYNRQPSFENNIFVNLKTSPDVYGVKIKQINMWPPSIKRCIGIGELVKSALIPDSSISKENTQQQQQQQQQQQRQKKAKQVVLGCPRKLVKG